jgi:hypothetical protein
MYHSIVPLHQTLGYHAAAAKLIDRHGTLEFLPVAAARDRQAEFAGK